MKLSEKGLPESEIIASLKKVVKKDEQYHTGRILGSMCTYPHEFAKKVACMFPEKNLGDPGLFPGTASLEKEVVQMIGDMLGSSRVVGNITTGGSEANIIAMHVAKTIFKKKNPEVIVPESAHASFHKAADFMGFKLKVLKLNKDYTFDLGDLERKINDNTQAVVGIAGTTALGLVDPIEEMGKIIADKSSDIHFHVDAAFGGFVIPFLKDIGHEFPKYDFEVKEVTSMTADPHKMGCNLIPSGCFLLRDEFDEKTSCFDIPYLAGGSFKHYNIMGTRPGNTVLSCWGLMKLLGREGYRELVKASWENTLYFRERLKDLEKFVGVAREPVMNVIGIVSNTSVPITKIDKELRKNRWYIGLFESYDPPLMRIVMMPHITRDAIDEFFVVFEKVLEDLNT
ncbi:MAG: tyrosine decarboxylase MfnA [Candidatus Hodarchaeota archaeon]